MQYALRQRGLSLLELLIFIVILGLIGTSLMIPFNQFLTDRNKISGNGRSLYMANQIAKERLALILNEKTFNGYTSINATTYPCKPPPSMDICTLPKSGGTDLYLVETTIVDAFVVGADTGFKQITVIVKANTGPAPQMAKLVALVSEYPGG